MTPCLGQQQIIKEGDAMEVMQARRPASCENNFHW